MKVITLLPVKNEAWILRSSLKNMSDFSDHIIIADQNSNDGSIEIYKEFKKVIVIENKNNSHNNSVRWQLLDFAREQFGTGNIIICIDADEMLQVEAIKYIKDFLAYEKSTVSFSFPWIQLWGNQTHHRVDSVWKDNYKGAVFYDDGNVDYERKTVLNDHTGRIPQCDKEIMLTQFPLLHFQYINLSRAAVKQAWYRCNELLQGNSARKINHKYSVAANSQLVITEPVNPDWLAEFPTVSTSYNITADWRFAQILEWFDAHSIAYFESLDIWNIHELHTIFLNTTGREPRIKKYPNWLITLNSFKNNIRK